MVRRQLPRAFATVFFVVLMVTATSTGLAQQATPTDTPAGTPTDGPTQTPQEPETPVAENATDGGNVTDGAGGVEANVSRVRVVHVSPVVPGIDVTVDGQSIAENASFGTVTDYATVESGQQEFAFVRAGTDDQILESEVSLAPASNYSVLAVGTLTDNRTIDFQPTVLRDEFTVPDEENASLRFVHAAPDTPPVDVTLAGTNTTVADNVTFRQDGPYVTVPAGNATLEIRDTRGDDGPVVRSVDLSLEGGTAYTAVAFGYLDSRQAPVDVGLTVGLSADAGAGRQDRNETAAPTPAG